jgi:hypothetical protein
VPFSPKKFLGDLLAYKKDIFGKVSLKNGTYYQATKASYYVKCYDKGAQYGRGENILRFEVKVRSMRFLHDVGIHALQDLMNGTKLVGLGELLHDVWKYVLVREPMIGVELTPKEQRIVKAVESWEALTKNQRYSIRKEYAGIIEKYCHGAAGVPILDRKKVVGDLISEKWRELLQWDVCSDLHAYAAPHPNDVCNDLHAPTFEGDERRLQRSSIVDKRHSIELVGRVCKVTGVSIVHQREGSVFVSEKTLKTQAAAVDAIRSYYGRKKRKRDYHTEEYYIAHSVRNQDSNRRNNLRRRINRLFNQPMLFDPWEGLRITPEHRELVDYWRGTRWEISGLNGANT